jgi:Zn-dependent M28 family amino/carboxypeptidase
MKRFLHTLTYLIFLFSPSFLFSQTITDSIRETETSRIIHVLADDSLEGRGNKQPGLLKAARFIGNEFSHYGLTFLTGYLNYYFPFWPSGERIRKKDSLAWDIEKVKDRRTLYNVVAMLPGRSRPGEIVVFSAHYDHLGIMKKDKKGNKDVIMNGANDDASGTTAMLMLAQYFAARNDNERTLLFCAFAGEELGLEGSADFIKYIQPKNIVANINLEMIGVPQFGSQTVFITGQNRSKLGHLLRVNLQKNGLNVINEPDPRKELFSRSDNYNFFMQDIPAHTIMGSDDEDACYHQPCDDVNRIDIGNMTAIIQAIAAATRSLISGEEKL